MQQSNASSADGLAAAGRIAELEAEIAARRAEIGRLQAAAAGDTTEEERDDFSIEAISEEPVKSANLSLEELIVLWEQRLSNRSSGANIIPFTAAPQSEKGPAASASAAFDVNGPPPMPAIVYTSSTDSDETRDAPPSPSPRSIFRQSSEPFGSPKCVSEPVAVAEPIYGAKALERMVEERDRRIESLEAAIASDTDIIKKMKDAIERMVDERGKRARSSKPASPQPAIVRELESTIALQKKQNERLKDDCVRLQQAMMDMLQRTKDMADERSSQENVVEFMKAEMVKMLLAYRTLEEETDARLARRDGTISDLECSFRENSEKARAMMAALGVRNSALEDEVEELKAECTRMGVRCCMLEEEKRMAVDAANTEMQLFYIENSRHEIL